MTDNPREGFSLHYGDNIGGDGIRQSGPGNIGKIDARGTDPDDLAALRKFVAEVQRTLPSLGLDAENEELARQQITQIAVAQKADPPNRRLIGNLAGSLRTIVQSAATTALTTRLIDLWSPPT